MQERIRAVKVPPMIGRAIGQADTGDQSQEGSGMLSLCDFCCMPCFLPCLTSKICLALFACLVIVPAIVVIGFTAAGPLQCTDTLNVSLGGVTIALICVVLFILLLCFCIQLFQGEDSGACRRIIYCCNCLAIILLLGLLIADIVLLYTPERNGRCNYMFQPTPFVTVYVLYVFIFFASWFWCVSCSVVLISRKQAGQETRLPLIKQAAP